MKFRLDKYEVDAAAAKHGYTTHVFQENIGMASYSKKGVRVNVYLTTATVATCIDHPKQGKTQLFRRNVSIKLLDRLFDNPREHTGKGYFTRKTDKI